MVDGWFTIWDLAKPVIAQVHGYCLAGGSELATACDVVFVAEDAQIGYPPVRLMSPPDMQFHPWMVGMRRAMELMLTGDAMSGTEAADWGYATRAFPLADLESATLAFAERAAKIPTDLQQLNKRSVHRAMEIMGARAAMRAGTEIQALAFTTESSLAYRKNFRRDGSSVRDQLDKRDTRVRRLSDEEVISGPRIADVQITQRSLQSNGITMHVAEAGEGPAVLLCHGFPESWYSWRHQLSALANAGYRAIAPHMRGYGLTDKPEAIDQYTMLHLTGDMVGVLDALDLKQAVIVGHDWGAPVAWHSALFRPDRFPAVVGLSVPFRPRGPARPTTVMPRTDDAMFYQLYFQQPGVAEADAGKGRSQRDPRHPLFAVGGCNARRRASHGIDRRHRRTGSFRRAAGVAELAIGHRHRHLRGRIQGERFSRRPQLVSQRRSQLAAARTVEPAPRVTVPALYIAGERDLVLAFRGMDQLLPNLTRAVPKLEQTIILPGCGHWTQQERPDEVNAALVSFLKQHHR